MSNPFKKITKNAEESKSQMHSQGQRTETGAASKSCSTCGAPRPKNTNLVKCDYCKTSFMENVSSFNADS
ncbi:hypothetical protein ACFSQJ_19510 [Croceitalea marina]|uniref:Uncharacterized protein n=1 Tax=Croceitalea marina TaxID=1775166 RepID=A0ABW5N1Z2_9FLAO